MDTQNPQVNPNASVTKDQFTQMYSFAKSNKNPEFSQKFSEALQRGDFNKFGTLKPAGAPEKVTSQQQSSIPSFGQRVATDIQNRGAAVQGAITGTSPESQGQPDAVRGLQATAQGFGAVTDVAKEALTVSPERTAQMQSLSPGANLQSPSTGIVPTAVSKVANAANDELGIRLKEWIDKNPKAGKALESVLKGTVATGEIAGTIAGVDVAGLGLNEVPVLGAEANSAAVGTAVKDLTSSTAQGVKDIVQGAKDLTQPLVTKAKEVVGNKIASSKINKTLDLVKATEDIMTKGEKLQAIGEDRLVTTKTGGKKYLESKTEIRASELLNGKLKSNPVANVPIIKKEISTLGKDAEQYLAKNPVKITAQEQADMFSKFREEAGQSLTETELKAYDEQMKLFLKQIPGRGGYNTSNFYQGLKDYEANVADHLPRGQDALLDPTGVASAKLHAASDIRKIVRDEIGNRHPQFKSKMFDLASLYDAKSTMITKALKLEGNVVSRFAKKHPYITATVAGEAGRKILTGGF